jgi:FKBP12-rapamycin complex-associated protein
MAAHPLLVRLDRCFDTLLADVDKGVAELRSLVDDEGEVSMHRGHPANAQHNRGWLMRYLRQRVSALFDADDLPASPLLEAGASGYPSSAGAAAPTQAQLRLGGVTVVAILSHVEYCDLGVMTLLFSSLLVKAVACDDDVSRAAAAEWGRLLGNGCALNAQIVHAQCTAALEQLRVPARRFSANLLLLQMLQAFPAPLLPQLELISASLWDSLRDDTLATREQSACTLEAALRLAVAHTANMRDVWSRLLHVVLKFCEVKHLPTVHGAFVALQRVLDVAGRPSPAIDEALMASAWQVVLQSLQRPAPCMYLYQATTDMLPFMARFDRQRFMSTCLPDVATAAATIFRGGASTQAERAQMFLVIGRLALQLRGYVNPAFVQRMMGNVARNLECADRCDAAATCLAMMAEADTKGVRPYMAGMMRVLFLGVPTVAFARDVAGLCVAFPELHSMCLDAMLALLEEQLSQSAAAAAPGASKSQGVLDALDAVLALDFRGYSVLSFLVEQVLPHLNDGSAAVRWAAARTCAYLIFSGCEGRNSPCRVDAGGAVVHGGLAHTMLISQVQSRLVSVAVADADTGIRLRTLGLLGPEFDSTLSSQEPCRTLLPALNDKPANRQAALRLLGRLSRRNPGCVFPMLRRIMMQCSTELHFLGHVRQQERKQQQATALLGTLVEAAPALVAPYATSLLGGLMQQLRSESSENLLVTSLLSTVGKLVLQVPHEDLAAVPDLSAVVVAHILDRTSQAKQIEAMRALGAVVRATHDIDVYERFPGLFQTLTGMLYGGGKAPWAVRLDVLTLMGIIGATDPAKIQAIERQQQGQLEQTEWLMAIRTGSDERMARVAVHAIINVLADASLDDECAAHATAALVRIFESKVISLQTAVHHMVRIIPRLVEHLTGRSSIRVVLLQHLSALVAVIQHHVRSFLDPIFVAAHRFLDPAHSADSGVTIAVVHLVMELRRSLGEEFKPFIAPLLPHLAAAARCAEVEVAEAVMGCYEHFGPLINSHFHIVLPTVLDIAGDTAVPAKLRRKALVTLRSFAATLPNMVDHAAHCVHALCRVLQSERRGDARAGPTPVQEEGINAINAIMSNLGSDFRKFESVVLAVINDRFRDTPDVVSAFMTHLDSVVRDGPGVLHDFVMQPAESARPETHSGLEGGGGSRREPARCAGLRQALASADAVQEDEWVPWLYELCVVILEDERQSRPLQACVNLARSSAPFARQLFNPAFASLYNDMDAATRRDVVDRLARVLNTPNLPLEVLQELLNLGECMERINGIAHSTAQRQSGSGFFDLTTLIERSEHCSLHAKALHYAESQFSEITTEAMRGQGTRNLGGAQWAELLGVCNKIIYLANHLGHKETANGVLLFLQRNHEKLAGTAAFRRDDPDMYAKLQWWSESYKAYKQRWRRDGSNVGHVLGMMTALNEQSDFPNLLVLWTHVRRRFAGSELKDVARLGARAAWMLQKWDDLEDANALSAGADATHFFYSAMLARYRNDAAAVRVNIAKTRQLLDRDLSAQIAESYARAYPLVVGLQQLSELEELQTLGTEALSVKRISVLWSRRLEAMEPSPVEWQGTLSNHSIVLKPEDDLDTSLRFVAMCTKSGRPVLARYVLRRLLGPDFVQAIAAPPLKKSALVLAAVTFMYDTNHRERAMACLDEYTQRLTASEQESHENISRCHTKFAEWHNDSDGNYYFLPPDRRLERATELDPRNHAAWRMWATVHKNMAARRHKFLSMHKGGRDRDDAELQGYVRQAIHGFLQCAEAQQFLLQDILGLLSLWFTHSVDDEQEAAIKERVHVDAWLNVVPQIIARIHTTKEVLQKSVHALLKIIATHHPQVLLYPLHVSINAIASGADIDGRRQAAADVLQTLSDVHGAEGQKLVQQAQLVSAELARCAVLWIELWRIEVEACWVAWQQRSDSEAMWQIMEPLITKMLGAETPAEKQFRADFSEHIRLAAEHLLQFNQTGDKKEMTIVWDILKADVYQPCDKLRLGMTSLVLEYISPALLSIPSPMCVVVPGQYAPNRPSPKIGRFDSFLKIMPSKQKPRVVDLTADDGAVYRYLLKGHEDLRLDERVMQLLGLVNTLLEAHASTAKKDALAKTYSVTPLSDNAGLIGWVDNCDTLHAMVEEYRLSHKLDRNREIALMKVVCESDKREELTLMQRVETFEYALDNTTGNDIARVMWIRSPNAEVWLDHRTMYVRTLASMSMTGHVMGLGDRHPGNLMMHTQTGKIVHIDFGDCFEVTMIREQHAEKVPFRLTRMLEKAMEVSGIDGIYRHTCISVMSVLRTERDSLLALLEAFVDDPLISWRLDANNSVVAPAANHSTETLWTSDDGDSQAGQSVSRHGVSVATARVPVQQQRAFEVVNRIRDKLVGSEDPSIPPRMDAQHRAPDTVRAQVARLIRQATSHENLCQNYSGWCPYW